MEIIDPITLFCIALWFVVLVVFITYKSKETERELKEYIDNKLQECIDKFNKKASN